MQQQLLKCCMIVGAIHKAPFMNVLCVFRITVFCILSLAVTQTVAVGPVLRVNKLLHLELGSQHGLSNSLLVLLYGFNF